MKDVIKNFRLTFKDSVDLRSWVLNRIVRMPHIEMLDYLWELG